MKTNLAPVFLLLLAAGRTAAAEPAEDRATGADLLAREGRFSSAEEAYREDVSTCPTDRRAALGLGRMLLYRGALEESEGWLRKALGSDGNGRSAAALLAENLYRRGAFAEAAGLFEAAGSPAKAAVCSSLARGPAYAIEGPEGPTAVPFLQTDPLPLIGMRIHGEEAFLLIDTGAAEIVLNADFADRIGLEKLGEQKATYAGGLQARVWQSVAETVEVGGFTVRNVPVTVNERKAQLPGFARPVSGIVGTAFLYRFLFTLDYPGGRLLLARHAADGTRDAPAPESGRTFRVPFWLCGDHVLMAWGGVNETPCFLFLDSGMAGGGFSVSERVLAEARIALPETAGAGMGGGGAVQVKRIRADLSLGGAREKGVDGFYGVMAPAMEDALGFRIDGILSHGFFRSYACTFDVRTMTLTMTKGE